MLVINNTKGAQEFTTATIFIDGEKFATLRSLNEVTKNEMTEYLKRIFDGCFTNHLGESELVLGNRFIDLGNGVTIETEVDWVDGGLVNCHLMQEWEDAIKRASKLAKTLEKEDE